MKLKGPLYTASNMKDDPRWKTGDLTRISILCNQRGVRGNFIKCAIRGLRVNSSNARKHFGTVREIAEEYLAAREAGSPIEVLTPLEELKQLRSMATTAEGTGSTPSTPSTTTLPILSDAQAVPVLLKANHVLAEEHTQLTARNAALEENTLHVQAELRKREEQLVEAGKDAEVRERECEALRNANAELLGEVETLQQRDKARDEEIERTREINKKNADAYYKAADLAQEAVAKADELEAENERLRKAILEQATVFATTIKALLAKA